MLSLRAFLAPAAPIVKFKQPTRCPSCCHSTTVKAAPISRQHTGRISCLLAQHALQESVSVNEFLMKPRLISGGKHACQADLHWIPACFLLVCVAGTCIAWVAAFPSSQLNSLPLVTVTSVLKTI